MLVFNFDKYTTIIYDVNIKGIEFSVSLQLFYKSINTKQFIKKKEPSRAPPTVGGNGNPAPG